MMPRVYFVPGLGGSSLGTSLESTSDTWVNYAALAEGLIGRLRLAADGITPGVPDGVQMFPGGPLPDYYSQAIAYLTAQLQPNGYVIEPYGYDWRIDADNLGSSLALDIELSEHPSDPCTIVAHSYGGLVARAAWYHLGTGGNQNLVRRIITLGTPHWGSYGTVRFWSADNDSLNQVWALSMVTLAIYGIAGAVIAGRYWSPSRIMALGSTWPSLYWTLPSLMAPDADNDPNRSAIYGNQWPADRGVAPNWLNAAPATFQPYLANANSYPPAWVLTTVAGKGLPTADRLNHPAQIGQTIAYELHDSGDGTVTTSSALLPGSAQYTVTSDHFGLPKLVAGNGSLASWVLDPRGPPSPAPPAVVVAGQLPQHTSGPPSTEGIITAPPIPKDP